MAAVVSPKLAGWPVLVAPVYRELSRRRKGMSSMAASPTCADAALGPFPRTVQKLFTDADGVVVEYCPRGVAFTNAETGQLMIAPCRCRRCPYCGPVLWKPRQQASYMAGVDGVDVQGLKVGTLTAPGTDELLAMWRREWPQHAEEFPEDTHLATAIAWWNDTAPERWTAFVRRMRVKYGEGLEFWKVAELQERGAIHYHLMVRGVRWIQMEVFRALAVASGFGPRIGLEGIRHDCGTRGLLGYFTGYLLKAVAEWSRKSLVISMTHGWRLVWSSRRARRDEERSKWQYVPRARVPAVEGWPLSSVGVPREGLLLSGSGRFLALARPAPARARG